MSSVHVLSRNYDAVIYIPNITHDRKVKNGKMFPYFLTSFNKFDWATERELKIYVYF